MFISYRRTDRAAADHLFELLRARNVAAWYDQLIPPGSQDWRDELVERLSQARVMVVMLSSAALTSKELRKELAVADQESVPLLTARLENIQPKAAFAYELARGNWFDVFEDPDSRLPQLADFLRDLVTEPAAIPERLEASLRAREERRRRDSFRVGFLRSNGVLAAFIAVSSVLEFTLYQQVADPVRRLIEGGVGPLRALMYVVIAVTVGSPILFLSGLLTALRGGLDVVGLALLATAAANTSLLFLLVWRFIRWTAGRLTGVRRR